MSWRLLTGMLEAMLYSAGEGFAKSAAYSYIYDPQIRTGCLGPRIASTRVEG